MQGLSRCQTPKPRTPFLRQLPLKQMIKDHLLPAQVEIIYN